MLKRLLNSIRLLQERNRLERTYKRSIELEIKRDFIIQEVSRIYDDIDKIYDIVDIHPYLRAEKVVNRVIKKPSDIDRLYIESLKHQGGLL